jgi:hypothetical protein
MERIRTTGTAWGSVKALLMSKLPDTLEDRDSIAYNLVPKALNQVIGPQDVAWHGYRNEERRTTYVRVGPKPKA